MAACTSCAGSCTGTTSSYAADRGTTPLATRTTGGLSLTGDNGPDPSGSTGGHPGCALFFRRLPGDSRISACRPQDTWQQLLAFAGLCCCGGRCAAGAVLASQDGIRPAPITRSEAQLPGLAHRQSLSALVVGPPAPGKVIPRLFI